MSLCLFLACFFVVNRKASRPEEIIWTTEERGVCLVWMQQILGDTAWVSKCTEVEAAAEDLQDQELLLRICLLCFWMLAYATLACQLRLLHVSILTCCYYVSSLLRHWSCFDSLADRTCSYWVTRCSVYVVRLWQPSKAHLPIHKLTRDSGQFN